MSTVDIGEHEGITRAWSSVRGRLSVVLAVACPIVALSLLAPFVLRQNAWLEWGNALWLVERQADSISATGRPTYFLHGPETGDFYPQFLFYGGSLFAFTGALAALIGSAWWAFVAVLVLATASAYTGTLWLARQAGLDLGAASLAALVVATSPYTVTALYGRGAWTEIVATSALPLGLAGALAVLRGSHPRAGIAAVGATAAIVAGSHNITVVWGTLVCAAIALVGLWASDAAARQGFSRRLLSSVGALVLGAALVAWTFLPAAIYGRETRAYTDGPHFLDALFALDRLDVILRPDPYVPPSIAAGDPASHYQLPVYVLAWCIAAIAAAVVGGWMTRTDRRLAIGLSVLLVGLVALAVVNRVWHHLPGLLTAIQFPLRLHAYIVIVIALLVVVALRISRSSPRPGLWIALLAVAVASQTALAEFAAWDAPKFVGREAIRSETLPAGFADYPRVMYRTVDPRPLERPAVAATFGAPGGDGRARAAEPPDGGTTIASNLVKSPFSRVRSPWRVSGTDTEGFAVLNRGPAVVAPPVAESAHPWPVVVGTILSLTAMGVLGAGGVVLAARALRRRSADAGSAV